MRRLVLGLLVAVASTACLAQTVKVAPVTVEPIHMTIDVNVHDDPLHAGSAAAPAAAPAPTH